MCHFHTKFYSCRHDPSSRFIECDLYTDYQRRLVAGLSPSHPKLLLYLEICRQDEDTCENRYLCPGCDTLGSKRATTAVRDNLPAVEESTSVAGGEGEEEKEEGEEEEEEGGGGEEGAAAATATARTQPQEQDWSEGMSSAARKEMMMMLSMELALMRRDGEGEAEEDDEEDQQQQQQHLGEETLSDEDKRAKRWEEVMRRRAEEFLLAIRG